MDLASRGDGTRRPYISASIGANKLERRVSAAIAGITDRFFSDVGFGVGVGVVVS
jgi:hypothetical protein